MLLHGEFVLCAHFDGRYGSGQRDQQRIAKVVHQRVPGRQQVLGNRNDGIQTNPPCVNEPGIVGQALAELEPSYRVGALAQSHLKLGRLQAQRIQIRPGIVWNELTNPDALEHLQRFFGLGVIGARLQRVNHAPELAGGIAPQFKNLRAVGHRQPVECEPLHIKQRRVAPVIGSAWDIF